MHYLIAYDICEPRRLRRVARFFEKHAVRCQKSVFIFTGETAQLLRILNDAVQLIDATVDVVQAWQLAPRESTRGKRCGSAPELFPDTAIINGRHTRCLVEDPT
jgi:CRISPR-associated protein Cas2